MNLETDVAAPEGGEDTYEADLKAAMEADSADLGAEPGPEPEPEAEEAKPQPTAEDWQKKFSDQQGRAAQERAKRREAEQRAEAEARRREELEARLTALEQGKGQGGGERPNPQEDPIGYMEWIDARLEEAEAAKTAEAQQDKQRQEQTRAVQAVITRASEYEADFRDANPDYDKAADYLYEAKKAEYTDAGYSDQEAHSAVMAEFISRAERAMKAGKDPAQIVFNMAKKLGFSADEAQARAAAAAKDKLARIAEGQKATSPLATAGGRGGDDLDPASIANLDGAAFDAAFAKLEARARRLGL